MASNNSHSCLDLTTASQLLEDVFDRSFTFYQKDNEWASVGDGQERCSYSSEELAQLAQHSHLEVRTLGNGQHQVAVPIQWFDQPTVAIGTLDSSDTEETSRLGRLALRLMRQHIQLQQQTVLFDELSQRAEENTWMRSFSELIETCEASHSVHSVAQQVLPRLQKLIDARSICFLPAPGSRLSKVCCGEMLPDSIPMLLETHQERSLNQPVVLNARSEQEYSDLKLTSFIMIHVGNQERCFGWLIAVDKNSQAATYSARLENTSEHEFGTVEAGLMQAAASLLSTHAHNVQLVKAKESLTLGVIQSIVKAVDARDPYTKGHSDRVALYAREIAREMNFDADFCERIFLTGLLHDVGKIGIPDAVLKKSGRLTRGEYEIIKRHPDIGFHILSELDGLEYALDGVRYHHERPDGQGYPDGLAGHDIPLDARILSVADAYDAMTSSRSYRSHMPFEKAEQIVQENIGTQFDEEAAAAFFRALSSIHAIAENDRERRLLAVSGIGDENTLAEELLVEIDTAVSLCSNI